MVMFLCTFQMKKKMIERENNANWLSKSRAVINGQLPSFFKLTLWNICAHAHNPPEKSKLLQQVSPNNIIKFRIN